MEPIIEAKHLDLWKAVDKYKQYVQYVGGQYPTYYKELSPSDRFISSNIKTYNLGWGAPTEEMIDYMVGVYISVGSMPERCRTKKE